MRYLSLVALLFSFSAMAFTKVPIDGKIFVAKGFDDNDLVEVVVVGTLPSSCHRNPIFEIERLENKYVVNLFAYYVKTEEGCRDVNIGFTETIQFGLMPSGEYEIVLKNKRAKQTAKLNVGKASNKFVDEFLYGNVNAVIENDANREIILSGVNPTDCLVFDHLTSEVQDAMIILRPHFIERGTCHNRSKPFQFKYVVPDLPQQPKGIMIHVRIMNGKSFNYFYQNRL